MRSARSSASIRSASACAPRLRADPAVEGTPPEAIRARYELAGTRVVLCVAAKRPHKNQELLIRAAALLEPDVVVVLAGHAEPYELELRSLARELGLADRVRFVGYVSDADLEGLWERPRAPPFPRWARVSASR